MVGSYGKRPLCFYFDDDNHGQEPNMLDDTPVDPNNLRLTCKCGYGDFCELYKRKKDTFGMSIFGMVVFLTVSNFVVLVLVIGLCFRSLQGTQRKVSGHTEMS